MKPFDAADILTDAAMAGDPYPYFECLRSHGGAMRLPHNGVVAVVGYDEAMTLLREDGSYSAVNAASGFVPLPFTPEGDDITAQISQHRNKFPFSMVVAAQDAPEHTKLRVLLMGLLTPKRLKANEEYMWRAADGQIDRFIALGRFDVVRDYAPSFATLVIADLLGVPTADRQKFAVLLSDGTNLPGTIGGNGQAVRNPLETIGKTIFFYIAKRRLTHGWLAHTWLAHAWPVRMGRKLFGFNPRREGPAAEDILTQLALKRYADGTRPRIADVVGLATFLFAAGKDTTAHLIANALRYLAEDPELQRRLRKERALIPNFVEEVLRLDGTVKIIFRLAKKPVKLGDLDVAPGTTVMIILAAASRDPHRFERPGEIVLERSNIRDNMAFSRGIHACPGSPLARAEARITIERFFDRTEDIQIDEAFHGPSEARRYDYLPTYMFRGLRALHLKITPARGNVPV